MPALFPIRKIPAIEALQRRHLLSTIPVLHSFPEADHVAYLDFDGHDVTGSSWNNVLETIHAPAFDVDGDASSFSDEEIDQIKFTWERMAEDFRPFNIDITTEDPSLADPDIFKVGGKAQRILFSSKFDSGPGGTGNRWFTQVGSGAAVNSWKYEFDNPAWVFYNHRLLTGELGSHELGHALGLKHDGSAVGTTRIEYRGGHGSGETKWSPIMGRGSVLSQWSNGEYPNANNRENDIGLIAKAIGFREDDYSHVQPLHFIDEVNIFQEGIIHERTDRDVFTFQVTPSDTLVRIAVEPWHNGPNLDIGISFWSPTPSPFIKPTDPVVNPLDKLSSSFELQLQPGTYYLTVDGVGKAATDGDPGYSDYGSLGYYKIIGQIGDNQLRGDINGDGTLTAQDIDAIYSLLGAVAISGDDPWRADFNGDQVIDQTDVDFLVRNIFRTEYGDFDLDRDVDFHDFLLLSANFGKQDLGWADGNATNDTEVAFADFLRLAATFGFQS